MAYLVMVFFKISKELMPISPRDRVFRKKVSDVDDDDDDVCGDEDAVEELWSLLLSASFTFT